MAITKYSRNPNDEILEGITWNNWLRQIGKIVAAPETFGLTKINSTEICQGNYCKRKRQTRLITFVTNDGLYLCTMCARLWAARVYFKKPHGMKDL